MFGQKPPSSRRGALPGLAGARGDARWADAVRLTGTLWLVILLVFLPALIARHHADSWSGIALDASTVLISIALALGLFGLFRATVDWPTPARVWTMLAAVLSVAALQTALDLLFTAWVARNLRPSWSMVPVDMARASQSMLNYVATFTMNVALFQVTFSRRRSLSQERQLAAAQSAAQQAQLAVLRLQLNPHFLFNTLNAISSMIITRRNDDAEQMTDKLSSFLRASLACDPLALVSVEEELGLTSDYLEIEAVRFGDRLNVDIRCTEDARDLRVPGMLIQPLVENAIKHGVARAPGPVTIRIEAAVEGGLLCLTVTNDAADDPAPADPHTEGAGLNDVRRRLSALYGDRGTLDAAPAAGGFRARIRLPARRAPDAADANPPQE